MFPHLEFIAGYNDAAESSERAESKEFVEDMLSLEQEFLNGKELKEVTKTFQKLGLYKQMDAAIWKKHCPECDVDETDPDKKSENVFKKFADDGIYLTSDLAATSAKPLSIQAERNKCGEKIEEIQKYVDVIYNYLAGEKEGYTRPPKEHHGTNLREAYSFFRQNEHCLAILLPENAEVFNPDRIIRMIYFDYMVSNFMDNYSSTPIKQLIGKHFPDDNLNYPDLTKAGIGEIRDFIYGLEGSISNYRSTHENIPKQVSTELETMYKHIQKMNVSFISFEPFFVPFSWVSEPHAHTPLNVP
jgi:hypothetical protein